MSGEEKFLEVVEELTECFGTEAVDWHEFEGMRTIYLRAGHDAMGHRCAILTIEFSDRGGWHPVSVHSSIPVWNILTRLFPDVNYDRTESVFARRAP